MNHHNNTTLALLSQGEIDTDFGLFDIFVFHDGYEESVVITKGKLSGMTNVICRIHSECITSHFFNSIECDCKEQMKVAQKKIQDSEIGIIIFLHQEGRGNGAAAHIATQHIKKKLGYSQSDAYEFVGFPKDNRSYNIAAKIIKFFNIKSIRLLSDNQVKIKSLKKSGIGVETDV